MIDKVREGLPPTRGITPPPPDWIPLNKTPTSVKDTRESMFNQLANAPMPEEFRQTWTKFANGACPVAQKAELLETRLNNSTATENAQKPRQRQANKVLKTRGILYAKAYGSRSVGIGGKEGEGKGRGLGKTVQSGSTEVLLQTEQKMENDRNR